MTFTIEFEPLGIRLLCEEPLSISDAARRAGVGLRSECGGKSICGKCMVRITPISASISPASGTNNPRINLKQWDEGWRLGCHTILTHNAKVFIPPTSQIEDQIVQTEGTASQFEPHPCIKWFNIKVTHPSLDDQISDLERVKVALLLKNGVDDVCIDLSALTALRSTLRETNWQVVVALREKEIIGAFPPDYFTPLGLAVDIGTTKIACYLVNLDTGQTIATKGVMNPQIAYGEDVMSRLEAVMIDPENAVRLQDEVINTVGEVAATLCASQSISPDHILDLCLVGNTAMHHLLLKLPARPLALSPFVPALSSSLNTDAKALRLNAAPGANIYLPPPIAGFVGSDHLAFLLASQFGEDTRTRLGIDIGTNTEIALQVGDRIVSCSTASGPAFEGAHIRHGMRAAIGAIAHVQIDENQNPHCDVIGKGAAIGICGSGILDALAEMRHTGIINMRGRINSEARGVSLDLEGMPIFELIPGIEERQALVITQDDIDQILMAKGAIRAGIEILMDHLQITVKDIEEVVIAGAFGSYLDPYNAVRIGLLPIIPLTKIRSVGNAAGTGARMMLASAHCRLQAEKLAQQINYLELTVVPGFNRYFAKGIRLPEF